MPDPSPAPSMRARFNLRAAAPRLPGLLLGLVTFGLGIALMAEAGLGLGPWEAFHQGIGRLVGQPIGTVSIVVGIPILALWWPLGERPGLGTILNVLLIGTSTNVGLAILPTPDQMPDAVPLRLLVMAAGVVVIGIGSGLYLGADLGPGPRDGLMTGIHRRYGWSIRRARTAVELVVLVIGFLLGGAVGLGTIVFTFGIGPLVQLFLGIFDPTGRVSRRRAVRILEESPGTLGE